MQLAVGVVSIQIQGKKTRGQNPLDVIGGTIICIRSTGEEGESLSIISICPPVGNRDEHIEVEEEAHCSIDQGEQGNCQRTPSEGRDSCPI
jgi:hypothetical protein